MFRKGDVVVFPDIQVWDSTYPKTRVDPGSGVIYRIRPSATYSEKFIKEVMSVNEFDFISIETNVYGDGLANIGYVREDGGYSEFLAPIEMMRLKDNASGVVDDDSLFGILGL